MISEWILWSWSHVSCLPNFDPESHWQMQITACKKIIIVGISGTGKTHLSRQLAAATGLPLYHMDSIIWREQWRAVEEIVIQQELEQLAQADAWIVEGWIDWYSHPLLVGADAVIYLDFPGWLALWGGLRRWFVHRKTGRPELPKGCHDTWDWQYLQVMVNRSERPHIEAMLAATRPNQLIRVRSRREAGRLLARVR